MTRAAAFALVTLFLAACDDPVPIDCGLAPSAATADTAIGFKVDGRQVLQDSGAFYPQMYRDSASSEVTIIAGVGGEQDFQDLVLNVYRFHGAGAYPIYRNPPSSPFARASYYCTNAAAEQWVGGDLGTDTVYVTTFDSTTGAISGTFDFTATGYKYGWSVEITEGSFQGFALKY